MTGYFRDWLIFVYLKNERDMLKVTMVWIPFTYGLLTSLSDAAALHSVKVSLYWNFEPKKNNFYSIWECFYSEAIPEHRKLTFVRLLSAAEMMVSKADQHWIKFTFMQKKKALKDGAINSFLQSN